MNTVDYLKNARILAEYIKSLQDFPLLIQRPSSYSHMGALLVDSILQAGINYRKVVLPRVINILESFPEATTTSRFLAIMSSHELKNILSCKHCEKPRRLLHLTTTLYLADVETIKELQDWLDLAENIITLRKIIGIGSKTIDYINFLAGTSSIAGDRHLRHFVQSGNSHCTNYNYFELKRTIEFTADILEIPRVNLDYAIWSYYSK
jgi:hypothetical protein